MRAATYTVTPASAGQDTAECIVNYFGPGQGGSVDANIERWKSQVQGASGKPAPAKVAERKVRGLTITTVDASGTYSGMGGPTAAAPAIAARRDMRGGVRAAGIGDGASPASLARTAVSSA